jgi:hypothetical protein
VVLEFDLGGFQMGVTETVVGLGDGIASFFQPLLDEAFNRITKEEAKADTTKKKKEGELKPENERTKFPQSATNVLNAFYSAGVRSGFDFGVCKKSGQVSFDDELIAARLDAFGVEETDAGLVSQQMQQTAAPGTAGGDEISLDPADGSGEPVAFRSTKGCWTHTKTEGYDARGASSGEAEFNLAFAAAKIAIKMSFESAVTVVGQRPVTVDDPDAATDIEGFNPPGKKFSGKFEGNQVLTLGGSCEKPLCQDEWVSGTGHITILVNFSMTVDANTPDAVKKAFPKMGGSAGWATTAHYSFPFTHYAGKKPAGVK